MRALPTDLRKLLEKKVIAAREIAEEGAKAALEALAVHHYEPYAHMSPEARELRNRLRARARQLGDPRDERRGTQAIDHLVQECAYEHWHRILFARFLAENDLLIEPETGVAVSLEECRELAREKNADPWELASRFAQRMLPQIFRPDDPLLKVMLSREHQGRLETRLEDLPSEVFRADDSLGWVYQFWRAKRKDEINASGKKIGADELGPVTQLFTEHYMVLFLLHNTIGAWYAGGILAKNPDLAKTAASEDELRRTCALPGYEWEYLRFVREADGKGLWRPAAGVFEGWPKTAAEIRVMDPCCGSGHFLVAAFECLMRMRMQEEGLSPEEAAKAVLAENIHGLELDLRCTQIAAFNLAFAAWKFVGHVIPLPPLNVACAGLSVGVRKEEWVKLAGDNYRLRAGMERLYDLFERAPTLGSLIDPRRNVSGDMLIADYNELTPLLEKTLANEKVRADAAVSEMAVTAQGMVYAATLLSRAYTLMITNVPYLTRGKQDATLKSHIEKFFRDGKGDLATAFVLRCLGFLCDSGTSAIVTHQNWLFLPSCRKLRQQLLREVSWNVYVRLGPSAFETITGEVVNVALLILTHTQPADASHAFAGFDLTLENTPLRKAIALCSETIICASQVGQLRNPDMVITIGAPSEGQVLRRYGRAWQGLVTGDDNRYHVRFWELPRILETWLPIQQAPIETRWFSGRSHVIRWEGGNGELHRSPTAHNFPPKSVLGKWGVAIQRMRTLNITIFTGNVFDDSVAPLIPDDPSLLATFWAFCQSESFREHVRKLNQHVKVVPGTLTKVPFNLDYWQRIAAEKYPNSLPEPRSGDPTQWLFHGHPAKTTEPLQVTVIRLLGYRWPAELDQEMRLAAEARELVNRCEELLPYADSDGIVCIPPVRGEEPAVVLLRALLAAAFGDEWTPAKERALISVTGSKAESLEEWLNNDFFAQHCVLFHHRPFIWHICDGRRDGFHALVNYHKLAEGSGKGRRLLESLTYSYLGDWIARQKQALKEGEAGAEDRLAAAIELQGELEKILEGEPPYDLFIRWKPLHQQPAGWEPDINDGVRLNIRPFMSARLSRGRKGAGVLRCKPTISWSKDRGTEPMRPKEDYPWFWNGDRFTGERHNDRHFTNAEKQAARERKAGAPA